MASTSWVPSLYRKHTHTQSEIENLDTTLGLKAASSHNHDTAYETKGLVERHNADESAHPYLLEKISELTSTALKRKIVYSLPSENIEENCIYMILNGSDTTGNIYDEYLYFADENKWERLGFKQITMEGYSSDDHSHPYLQTLIFQDTSDNTKNYSVSATDTNHAFDITLSMNHIQNLVSTLNGKAPSVHSHAISDVEGLQAALDSKGGSVVSHPYVTTITVNNVVTTKVTATDTDTGHTVNINLTGADLPMSSTDTTKLNAAINGKVTIPTGDGTKVFVDNNTYISLDELADNTYQAKATVKPAASAISGTYNVNYAEYTIHQITLSGDTELKCINLPVGQTCLCRVNNNAGKTVTYNTVQILETTDNGIYLVKWINITGTPEIVGLVCVSAPTA